MTRAPAALTTRQLNRATLDRQLLLRRRAVDVVDAVRRVVALQAQSPASPYLALWNRVAGFDPADLDAAFADGAVVRATLMRITLHAVHAADHGAFHGAMLSNLRASRLHDRRFTGGGSSIAEADALLPHLAEFTAVPRTGVEIDELIADRLGGHRPRMWWALRTYAPLRHEPTGGPWSFGKGTAFRASDETEPPPDECVQRLVLRYLEGFGPASAQDFARFTMLRRPVVLTAIEALGDRLERRAGPGGSALLDVAGASLPAEDVIAPPRLLPMWDSTLLAYADRARVVPEAYRSVVIRRNGDVLPTLLVDGHVAGVWRAVDGGIEATAFHRLDDTAWDGLEAEARALVAFLADREPAVYRRHAHWWAEPLAAAQVRVLPGG